MDFVAAFMEIAILKADPLPASHDATGLFQGSVALRRYDKINDEIIDHLFGLIAKNSLASGTDIGYSTTSTYHEHYVRQHICNVGNFFPIIFTYSHCKYHLPCQM
ncbi:hypothetical protein SAMN04244573_01343 [Azotobacter beijerinckii]|uniref:Uncharacterized protein n=1 Tax=Azotobacter beijerinckii TaxID=170623 RepID=A0A1H9EYJ3_9GAMM|nr:hypothetical protein SAMN04244573_01343 [Azotobacter beijerinckii]